MILVSAISLSFARCSPLLRSLGGSAASSVGYGVASQLHTVARATKSLSARGCRSRRHAAPRGTSFAHRETDANLARYLNVESRVDGPHDRFSSTPSAAIYATWDCLPHGNRWLSATRVRPCPWGTVASASPHAGPNNLTATPRPHTSSTAFLLPPKGGVSY